MACFVECWSFHSIQAVVLLLSWGNLLLYASAATNNATDRQALVEFKTKITHDPLGIMTSWNHTIHFCQWYGVICSSVQRVTILDLGSSKLEGTISPHIGNLTSLRILFLHNNSFDQEIPQEIGRLRNLEELRLHNNFLSGSIPSNISSCSNLNAIGLGYNHLVGRIPSSLGSLSNLGFFSVDHNLLQGNIPPSFSNLSSLAVLSASQNHFTGHIPDSLGHLKNLYFFSVALNNLSGTMPLSMFNISTIENLDVGKNKIRGQLPSDLGVTLPKLKFLGILGNQFTGSFPVSVSNASNLQELGFSSNKLTGNVPPLNKLHRLQFLFLSGNNLGTGGDDDDLNFLSSLANATSLEMLAINGNNFGGILPRHFLSNFSTKLSTLAFDNNQISGGVPSWIENLINLQEISASNNKLSGTIPPNIGKLRNLVKVSLSENNLSGDIPPTFGNLTSLIRLFLSGNDLQGTIPSSLSNCLKLMELDLSRNNLTGAIPSEVIGLSSLSIYLGLSQNHLTGNLPWEVGNLKDLGTLDISKNKLSGNIPSSLGSCISLEFLSIAGNFFQGSIPLSLMSLRGLRILDFSHNNLSGEIPDFLSAFDSLLYLNLSYNDLEGAVPTKGVFTNSSATRIMGNSKLCGGIPKFQLPVCNSQSSKKKQLHSKQKFIIALVFGLLGVALLVLILVLLLFRKKKKKPTSTNLENSLAKVSYQSLLKATNEFSSENLIGVGSFGSVYKGSLDQNGEFVAIKVLNLERHGAFKSFVAECEALRNIRHRNLVKVITACSGVDFQGNDFKALVYEFMVNGSLDDWLHPSGAENKTEEAPKNLNFIQRLNVAVDVACALEYLHHHCEKPIIHCDLKPTNILLDKEMTAHIGDFGLSKVLSEISQTFPPNQSSLIGVRGTIGYTPPEYGMGCEISTYGDVYSYGILLLEMFTGKRPTDHMFKDDLNLCSFAKAALPERAVEITDHVLVQEIRELENQRIWECLNSIFDIGVTCSAELPRERINICDVVAKLCSLRDHVT